MKKLPRLTDDAKFIIVCIILTLTAIVLIFEFTGMTDAFINSFN